MKAEFKSTVLADDEVLMSLRREFAEIEAFPNPFDETTNLVVLQHLIENEQFGKIWLIQIEGETAGYLIVVFGYSLEYAGRDALIDELYLREKFRGFGIGKQTLQFVADYCRSVNIRAVHVEVDRANIAAKTLYHKNGFVDHDRHFLTKWID